MLPSRQIIFPQRAAIGPKHIFQDSTGHYARFARGQRLSNCLRIWGERRGLNPRPSVPQTDALPAELRSPTLVSRMLPHLMKVSCVAYRDIARGRRARAIPAPTREKRDI